MMIFFAAFSSSFVLPLQIGSLVQIGDDNLYLHFDGNTAHDGDGDDEGWRCAANRGEASFTTLLLRDEALIRKGSKRSCYWRRRKASVVLGFRLLISDVCMAVLALKG